MKGEPDEPEIALSGNASEQLEYKPEDDPTLQGISIEHYISRRIFARTVAKDALQQLTANDMGKLNSVKGMQFNTGSLSYAKGLA